MAAHAGRAHALLGASGADRWINCPPSARLTENMAESRSEYADEGTAAHELSEVYLRQKLIPNDSKARLRLSHFLDKAKASQYYGPDMEHYVQEYVDIVCERFMDAKSRSADAVVLLEERLDMTEYVPEAFGTGDVVLISDGVLEVIDLKYGKGVPVSAINNPQIRLYALGALSAHGWLYDITEVRMTIVQPRLDSVTTDTMTVEDLLAWAEEVVRPAAQLAHEGKGEYKAGDHCKWCKAKGNCRARADANMAAIQYEFQDPALLSLEEIGAILHITEQLAKWTKDVQDFAQNAAVKGQKVPGWKLVEGRSNRTITDENAACNALEKASIAADKYLKPRELLGITELEKRVGKKDLAKLIGGLIVKPPGKPKLAPESDPRAEMNSTKEEFANINLED